MSIKLPLLVGTATLTATFALNNRVIKMEDKNPGIGSALLLISEGFAATTGLAIAGGASLLLPRMRPIAGGAAAAAAGMLGAALIGGAQVGNILLPLSWLLPDRYR